MPVMLPLLARHEWLGCGQLAAGIGDNTDDLAHHYFQLGEYQQLLPRIHQSTHCEQDNCCNG